MEYNPQFQNIFYFYTCKPKLFTELTSGIIEWPHKQNSFWESSGTSEQLSGTIAVSSLTDLDLQKAPQKSWYQEAGSLLHICTFQMSNPAEWGHLFLERHLRELNHLINWHHLRGIRERYTGKNKVISITEKPHNTNRNKHLKCLWAAQMIGWVIFYNYLWDDFLFNYDFINLKASISRKSSRKRVLNV